MQFTQLSTKQAVLFEFKGKYLELTVFFTGLAWCLSIISAGMAFLLTAQMQFGAVSRYAASVAVYGEFWIAR